MVGAIACRLERQPEGAAKLYIMTIGVLAPYRGHGIGAPQLQKRGAEGFESLGF